MTVAFKAQVIIITNEDRRMVDGPKEKETQILGHITLFIKAVEL